MLKENARASFLGFAPLPYRSSHAGRQHKSAHLQHNQGPDDLPADPQVIPCGDTHLAQRLAACLERYGVGEAPSALPAGLVPVLDAARAAGALAESALARRLDCVEEDVHDRLTPALHTVRDLVYIDGFGLCTAPWLAHVRTLIEAETAGNQGRLDLARLGRQLRRLVGHNE